MGTTADRLAQAMELRGVDQSALARALRVSQGSISKIVLGKTNNSRLLPRIATHLAVSLPWLLGETDDAEPGSGNLPEDPQAQELVRYFTQLAAAERDAILLLARSLAGHGAARPESSED